MLETLALLVILAASVYLIALAMASLIAPAKAGRFLLGFAGSRHVHVAELSIRFLVGGAFVIYAPRMAAPQLFGFLGWILLVTTVFLALLPWRWHQRFARQAVPRALRYIALIGLSSLIFGGLIFAAVIRGNAA